MMGDAHGERVRRRDASFSFRALLLVLLPLLTGLTGVALTLRSYRFARDTVTVLSRDLFRGLSNQAVAQTRAHLSRAQPAGELARRLVAEGLGLTVDDRAQLSRTLLAVLDANPPFSWVGFGGVDGTFVAAHRLNSGERRLNQSWITADRRTRLEEYALDRGPDGGIPVWHIAKKDSEWFSPSTSAFMINYRVDDLEELLAQLRSDGVETAQGPETHENGHFAWVLDPDGNKLELWQP